MLKFNDIHSPIDDKFLTRHAPFDVTSEHVQTALAHGVSPIHQALTANESLLGIHWQPEGITLALDTSIGQVSARLSEEARKWDCHVQLGIVHRPMHFRVALWGALTGSPYYEIEPALTSAFVCQHFDDTGGEWKPIAPLARSFGIEPGEFYFLLQEVEGLEPPPAWGDIHTRKGQTIATSDYRVTMCMPD